MLVNVMLVKNMYSITKSTPPGGGQIFHPFFGVQFYPNFDPL